MKIHRGRFNIYLTVLAVALLSGCASPEKRQMTTLRIHLESNRDISGRSQPVPIYRDRPFMVNVDKSPILTEAQVEGAKIVDTLGGFAIEVKFGRRGTWLLEHYSTDNRGKRFAIHCDFAKPPKEKGVVSRWLAAPVITQHIADGVLTFTPDATREEAIRIVRGLNNVAKKLDDSFKW